MKFLINDTSGHSTEVFDKANKVSMQEAEARFDELVGLGHAPSVRHEGQETPKIQPPSERKFDPEAEEVTFTKPLQGG